MLALAGCNREFALLQQEGGITVRASIGQMTKLQYSGNSAEFSAGDQILVYVWAGTAGSSNPVVDGVVNSFDGSKWTPDKVMNWGAKTDTHQFLGIYPVPSSVTSFTYVPFNMDMQNPTDLLIATEPKDVLPSATPVPLAFTHVMAKLNVNIRYRGDYDTTQEISSVETSVKTSGTVNYLTKEVTATGTESKFSIPATTAPSGFNCCYSSLVVPQDGVNRITVTVGEEKYIYESSAGIPLTGGKATNLNLALGKDKIEFDSVSVSDWTTGTDIPGGESIVVPGLHDYVDMGEVTIGGATKSLKWAACNIGAENPWDYGDYFAWGETTTKTEYNEFTYSMGDPVHINKYTGSDYTTLQPEDDAATKLWGGNWRIPTDDEWKALLDTENYSWTWTGDYLGDGSNHSGMVVIRKDGPCKDNSIFLPAAGTWTEVGLEEMDNWGQYWSSSLYSVSSTDAGCLYFNNTGTLAHGNDPRYLGNSIRPVTD